MNKTKIEYNNKTNRYNVNGVEFIFFNDAVKYANKIDEKRLAAILDEAEIDDDEHL